MVPRREYEKTWSEFLAFLDEDKNYEATEDDYMRYITYLAEEKHNKGSNAHVKSVNLAYLSLQPQNLFLSFALLVS